MASEVVYSSPSEAELRQYGLAPQYVPAGETQQSVTEKISGLALETTGKLSWWMLFLPSLAVCGMFGLVIVYLLVKGVGIWGINIPVAWCFAITAFVWWIGIGHAGTLISAFLLLMHQKWRTSINRLAEAMTIFAVMTAGMFPLLHLGRPWFFYWLLPYPNTMRLWPQFRSALVWDVFAVSTYFLVSLLFWYMGMIPDFATLRDRATTRWRQVLYGVLAMGWRNSARHWHRYETAYLLLAGLATPLVISVHSVVSSDFAIANVPGWHETVFPPYFVAGAIFSGFAMVLLISITLRRWFGLQAFITQDHLDVMGKLLLATSLITSYGYLSEQFTTYYGGEHTDVHVYWYRLTDFHKYAAITWTLFTCNTIVPQVLWIRPIRRSSIALFVVSVIVLIGLFFERYMIIASSLSEDFLPSSFGFFKPTIWDILTYVGSLGFFATLFLLFVGLMPVMSMSEMRAMLPGARGPEVGR
ncbi:MAG TPA: NrfD/PsrC family molybdoenzyme membrane anchor subunit [Pirellulaceae bacterium]|jgi:molybdopterin-containing oxidoreductase family membrane subunit